MKILQVIPNLCFGGAETMCENLTYALKNLGHQVSVVSLYDQPTPISQRMEAAGVSVTYLDKKPGLDLSMLPKLRAIFRAERPDVVHTHLDCIKYAVPAAKLAGVKRCVHTVHSVAEKEAEGTLQKVTNRFFYQRGWSVPVALSREVRQSIVEFYHLPAERVPVVLNGIDLSRYQPRPREASGHRCNLVHVGRMDTPKNQERLLHAFRQVQDACPGTRLTLVGDGALRPRLEALAEELGLKETVVFAGMQADVRPFLAEGDIFVLSSDYEGIPMTIIEAMAMGLPIVSTAAGGVPDLVEDQKTGLLTPCDAQELAKALLRLTEDPSLRQTLGQAAREGSKRFSSESMARAYLAVYPHHPVEGTSASEE